MAHAQVDRHFFFHCRRANYRLVPRSNRLFVRNTCDDTAPSPVVRNSRGDTAEGQVQVCTWIGTVVSNYITLQINEPTRI